MLFSSLEFLLLFFPVTFGVNFILPAKMRNYWLLLASLFFYAWGEPRFVLVMMASICMNYFIALQMDRTDRKKRKKAFLIFDLVLNLGLLFVFKYLNFLTSVVHDLIPGTRNLFPVTSVELPIGISFFTFQAISYAVDVYRGSAHAQRNIGHVGLYISLFPQLIAGPIVRYTTVMDQIKDRSITVKSFSAGMLRFMSGFSKKILLANVLAEAADYAFSASGGSAGMAWLGAVCYSLQIYYDFSGYSDMAIGLGKMLGFHFLENFDYPYISGTVTEFWRRWHISLGTWFRDYVYIPLGGSHVHSRAKLVRNLLTVWILTGIWHGANWTFLLWGLLYGMVLIFEKMTDLPRKIRYAPKTAKAAVRILTLLVILTGWVLFRSDRAGDAWIYLKAMFGANGNPLIGNDFLLYAREYAVYLLGGILCALPVWKWIREKTGIAGTRAETVLTGTGQVLRLVLFTISITMLVMNAHNPFIYFNF